MRLILRAYLIALIIILHFPFIALGAKNNRAANRLGELREEINSLKVELDYLNLKVQDSRANIKKLEGKINRQQALVAEIQSRIDSIASESQLVMAKIRSLQLEIETGKTNYQNILKRFQNRLVHLHKIRQSTLFSSIFSAKDLNSFLNRFHIVKYLLKHDRQILQELSSTKQNLEKTKLELQRKQEELAKLVEAEKNNRDKLEYETVALSSMLKTLVLERKLYLKKQESVRASIAELETEIARLEKKREKEFKEERLVLSKSASSQSSIDADIADTNSPKLEIKNKKTSTSRYDSDKLLSQVTQSSTSNKQLKFRMPLRKYNTLGKIGEALQLKPDGDAEVLAAAEGKVLFKGPMGSLGKVLIIGHPNRFSSVYGRLHNIWVGLGQSVKAGDVVATLIDPRESLLHFEIRSSGRAQDIASLINNQK